MNIAQNVTRSSRLFPERTAMTFEGQSWSYKRLEEETNRVANGLRSHGVKHGDRVALFLPNIPEFVVSYLGIVKMGGIAVSINSSLKAEEVAFILRDSGAGAVITTRAGHEHLPADLPDTLDRVYVAEGRVEGTTPFAELSVEGSADPCLVDMNREDPAAILYTSGTTGFPKGATLSHGNVISNMHSFNYNCAMRPDDRLLLYLPLFHCFGQNAIMNACFNVAATLILQRSFKPEDVHRAVVKEGVTMFFGVPTTFMPVYQRISVEEMSGVRYHFSAAAILPLEIAERWRAKYGREINEGYGLTETSPFACYNHLLKFKPGSIGQPIENVELRVVDEHDNEVAPGEKGELVIKGPNVMLGYWNRPQETAEVIRDGWFHSGDVGRMDEDGYFYIVDRVKDMINVGGLKVYPAEVENILYEHEAVHEAAVYGVPEETMGEQVWANVVLHPGAEVEAETLAAFCNERIASFKVPSRFIFAESLPKNPVGKMLKRVLREEAAQALGLAEAAPAVEKATQPLDPSEVRAWLARWLAGHLEQKEEEILVNKSFWEYGVTSVMAVRLATDLSVWIDSKVSPVLFWNFPSIASLTDRLMDDPVEAEEVEPLPGAPAPAADAPDDLSELSDEEMARLLAEEMGQNLDQEDTP